MSVLGILMAEPAPPTPMPQFPTAASAFAPSQARIAPGHTWDGDAYLDVDACEGCHASIVEQWRRSPHAHASFDNPFYRVAIDRFRAAAGNLASRFCAGCHDPALLFSGAIDAAIAPTDPRAHVGVACLSCHLATDTAPDGNGSYTLSPQPLRLPREGDPPSLAAHKAQMTPQPLHTDALCISCHRSFASPEVGVPHHLPGQDDGGAKTASPWGGSGLTQIDWAISERRCLTCHMPKDEGQRRHDVLGAHSVVAATDGPMSLARIEAFLRDSAVISIASVVGTKGPDDGLEIDIVIANRDVGHRFPGGITDLQDTWVEVEVADANGRPVAEAGNRHQAAPDPTAHRLESTLVDAHNTLVRFHDVAAFRTVIANHTVAPRDAVVIRYRAALSAPPAYPLTIRARLRHRRYPDSFRVLVCHVEADSPFPNRLDPCGEAPVIAVSSATATISTTGLVAATWQARYDYGRALLHGAQEQVHRAGPVLTAALALADAKARGGLKRAATLVLLARVAIAEHRTDDALATLKQARALAPKHPALDYLTGETYAAVWRWPKAAQAYAQAADAAPNDPGVWAELSAARGSAGDAAGSLQAAHRGLRLRPRHAGLLRSQVLALRALGATDKMVTAAAAAFSAHRSDDAHATRRALCGASDTWCDALRQPIRTMSMRIPVRQPPSGLGNKPRD